MLRQRVKQREQAANLAVQKKQEEQTAQSFTPYWNLSMIDDEKVLQAREKFMKAIQTFLQKFSRYPSGVMQKEHSIQFRLYLENSSKAIAPVLPAEEPKYSLSMGDVHLSTIPETESDEVKNSSVENLVSIPSESEVTSDNESECDVPVCDDFTSISNPLFDCNDDFTSSDDKSLSNEDVPMENFKIYSSPLFDDEDCISPKIDPYYFNTKYDLIKSLLNRDTLIDSSPKFYYLLELAHIDPIPPGIEEADFDLEEEIHLVENLYNDTLLLPKNESSNFDHHDDPSFPRPPPEPPDVKVFFDFEPDTGVLTAKVVEDISEHHVLMPKVLPSQTTLCPNIETFLSFSSENEDKVSKPGIDMHYHLMLIVSQLGFPLSIKGSLRQSLSDSLAPKRVVKGVVQPVAPTTAEQSLKIYEAKVESSSSASTSTKNIAFVSSSNTDSTNEPVSAAASISA
nr:hypothetical protein [Tanacetum cinerariifolium]